MDKIGQACGVAQQILKVNSVCECVLSSNIKHDQ